MASAQTFQNGWLARVWPFAPPFLVGMLLRLYGLSGQILVDDEWHSLNFVLDKSFFAVLGTHGMGANCIPQNLINWILLQTVGWSEWTLFLPSILCAAAGLLLFPPLVARLAGRTAAVFFAWLLALSPCLIFYSRIVRPYSMVLFFGFLALLCLALWTRAGRPRLLHAYALSGFVAVYFHLYAALPLLAPLGALFVLAVVRRRNQAAAPWISARALAGAGLLLAALALVFLGPAHWKNPWWMHVQGVSHATRAGLWEFLSLLAGTRFAISKLAFAALAAAGLGLWLKREFRVGLLFAAAWGAFGLLLAFGTQDGMHAAIQLARYDIVLFPLAMLLAATALDALLARLAPRRSPAARTALGLLPLAGLLAGSPLARTFALPNNFMHHSAFQDSYAPFDDSQSRVRALTPLPRMPRERLAPFYFAQARDPSVRGLVEYPMYVGDPFNFAYYAQHFHRRPVAAGYVPDFPFPPLPSRDEFVYGTTPIDYVLSRARALGLADRLRFRNLAALTDVDRLRRDFSGWLLVVHRDVLQETLGLRGPANVLPPPMLNSSSRPASAPPRSPIPGSRSGKFPDAPAPPPRRMPPFSAGKTVQFFY